MKWKKVVKAPPYIMQTAVTIIRDPGNDQCVNAQWPCGRDREGSSQAFSGIRNYNESYPYKLQVNHI